MCEALGHCPELPGSSEFLESLIGRGKPLIGQTSGDSLTKHILATATTDLSAELIRSALKSISIKSVQHWYANHLPRSLQSLPREDLAPTAEETNMRKHTPDAILDI